MSFAGFENRLQNVTWTTMYVTGRSGFDLKVWYHLKKLEIDFKTGSFNDSGTYLFWVKDDFDLTRLKLAMGSQLILKYRIRFFFNVDAFLSPKIDTVHEERMQKVQDEIFLEYVEKFKQNQKEGLSTDASSFLH